MCTRNSADRKREHESGHGAREGKIKGRGTYARASHGLHMGFRGTLVPRGVPYTALVVAIARDFSAFAPLEPVGVS